MVGVNEVAITSEVAPFGGVKHSGMGRWVGCDVCSGVVERMCASVWGGATGTFTQTRAWLWLASGMAGVRCVATPTSESSPQPRHASREQSKYGLDEFLNLKTVCLALRPTEGGAPRGAATT